MPARQPTLHQLVGAPDNLKLSASVRLRFEAIDGQVRPGFDSSSQLVSLRSTLFAEYDFGGVRLGGEIRDARVYLEGDNTPLSTNEVNTFEPVQAYLAADLGDRLGQGSKASVQAGRMIITLGSGRLVTSEEFRNTANGYTGVRADWLTRSGIATTLFWSMPQVRLPSTRAAIGRNGFALDRESPDLMLYGGLVTTPLRFAWGSADIGYFRLFERDGPALPTLDRRLHTFDVRLFRDPAAGRLDWEFEGAWQFGTISNSTQRGSFTRDVQAYFYHLELGYTWPGGWAPRLSAEFDYATGTRATGSYGRFDTLFGGRRVDFSPSGIYNEINRANIASPGLHLEVTPNKRLDGMFEARLLLVPERSDSFATTNVRDLSGRSGNYAGEQFDFRLRYWLIPKALRFELDFDYLRKGPFLRNAPNAPRNGDVRFVAVSLLATY
ncbi:hypothetical protein IP88_05515 [alpha proteobacterium AAP81b]|nr:hypothetical protein IP88_05515 [alpha proteobacterium AAP81b]